MPEPIITVENLSKKYRIGARELKDRTFREAVVDAFAAPVRNFRRLRQLTRFDDAESGGAAPGAGTTAASPGDVIWALKDVSFEVQPGEVVGVIGKNGAGKSTLLKILSRITEPSYGEIRLYGRVSSLLEVGTGFHPELTGRENIYLNGTILGMRKTEIDAKFDEIVAFSEIEKFLDTPVKRYSSGMYVRLAFAVAAHLEPEILLVDEVLAVGDAAFQKKCLGKMGDVAREGRTVLFVSHNMGAIVDLCTKAILLEQGNVKMTDLPTKTVEDYLSSNKISSFIDLSNWNDERSGNGPLRLSFIETTNKYGNPKSLFSYGEPISFRIGIRGQSHSLINVGISIRNSLNQLVLHLTNKTDKVPLEMRSHEISLLVYLEQNLLNDGDYYVTVWLGDKFNILNDRVGNCLTFSIKSPSQGEIKSLGSFRVPAKWIFDENSNS